MNKKKLAATAALIDVFYMALIVVFKRQLDGMGNVGIFLSYYLSYFLHFPLVLLFFGSNYWYLYFLSAVQTYLVFYFIGFGLEKKRRVSIVIGVIFYLILMGAAVCSSYNEYTQQKVVTEEDIKQVIQRDLPIGTSEEKVVSYLKTAGVDYNVDSAAKRIEAMERNVNKGSVVSASFLIVFNFGQENKLAGFTVEKKLTGP